MNARVDNPLTAHSH